MHLLKLIVVWSAVATTPGADAFPHPPGLEADIAFWTRVYTEVDTNSGFLHDSRNLGVIYEVVRFSESQSRRSRNRKVQQLREGYRQTLLKLATGKRQGLTDEQQRVLSLWPDDVSNSTLKAAASSLRFQLGQSNRYREGYERSGQWLGYIRQRFASHGLPEQLALLPHVESSFYPAAYSKVGASGMWQFTRSTGRRFMRIDHVVDERRDPYMATDAAAQLLEYNYSVLGSWPMALTAYNHGVAGMRRAVKKLGTDDPEKVFREYRGRTFGFASRNFYVAFLAAIHVDQNAEQYFGPISRRGPVQTQVVRTVDYLPADTVADTFGITSGELERLNPALLATVWSGNKHVPKGFALRLPDTTDQFDSAAMLASIDTSRRFDRQKPDVVHRIQRGETLSKIASQYGVRVSELVQLNGLRSANRIRSGQVLRLPVADGQAPPVRVAQASVSKPAVVKETVVAVASPVNDESPGEIEAAEVAVVANVETPVEVVEEEIQVALAVPTGSVLEPDTTVDEEPATFQILGDALLASDAGLSASAESPPIGRLNGELPLVTNSIMLNMPSIVYRDAPPTELLVESETIAVLADEVLEVSPQELSADPSDYTVAEDGTLEVQALETLGHYGDWLQIRTQRLRDANRLQFGKPVIVGQRLKLDFSNVDQVTFEQRRMAYHRDIQETFFRRFRIRDAQTHEIRPGESVWVLTHRRYEVPLWLLRQYNPDLDINRLRPGAVIQIPLLEPIEGSDTATSTSASSGIKKTATAAR